MRYTARPRSDHNFSPPLAFVHYFCKGTNTMEEEWSDCIGRLADIPRGNDNHTISLHPSIPEPRVRDRLRRLKILLFTPGQGIIFGGV